MGCASGKPASRDDKSPQPGARKEQPAPHADAEPKTYNFITIEVQNNEGAGSFGKQLLTSPAVENAREPAAPAEAHESSSTSKGEGRTDKEHKEDSRKELLKKYNSLHSGTRSGSTTTPSECCPSTATATTSSCRTTPKWQRTSPSSTRSSSDSATDAYFYVICYWIIIHSRLQAKVSQPKLFFAISLLLA
jgi:hypothetical protein